MEQMNEEVYPLPFTWRDVLKGFEIGQSKLFPVCDAAMVSTVRSIIGKYQASTDAKFSTRTEGLLLRITRER